MNDFEKNDDLFYDENTHDSAEQQNAQVDSEPVLDSNDSSLENDQAQYTSQDGYTSNDYTPQSESTSAQSSDPYTAAPDYSSPYSSNSEPSYSAYSSNQSTYQGSSQPQSQYSTPYSNYVHPANNEMLNNKKKKSGSKKGLKVFLCIALALVLLVSGIFVGTVVTRNKNDNKLSSNSPNSSDNGSATLEITETPTAASKDNQGILTSAGVAEKVTPSSVGIIIYSNNALSNNSSTVGEGSGVIMGVDDTGKYTYIITCAHVISEYKDEHTMIVQTHDGQQYEAEMVGYDERTDIGVIMINETGFTAAEFGDSSKIKVGETIYAIGNPGGVEFAGSFTSGVVSAIDRPISSEIGYDMNCIQHDAAINPGNSGGMLVNGYGQIIGINSSKIMSTSYEGMGFAIPISVAKTIVDSLIKNGYVPNRPKLGISYAAASNYSQYGMIVQIKELPAGSLIIASINSDSDMNNTDAKVGDLIIAVNGVKLDKTSVLQEQIEKSKVGDTLKLTLCRIGNNYQTNTFDVEVKLVEDKGNSSSAAKQEETTTQTQDDYYNFFQNPFGY